MTQRAATGARTAASGTSKLGRQLWYFGLCLILLLLVAGCGQTGDSSATATPSVGAVEPATATTAPAQAATDTPATAATPTSAAAPDTPTEQSAAAKPSPSAPAAADGQTFENPVLQNDFADPDVIKAGDTFYAFATNANGKNVQVSRSKDLVDWDLSTEAMPALPSWAQLGGSYVWAPAVIQIGDKYVMYYTARDKTADKQCIGVATSDKPDGKYLDKNDHALVCVPEEGADIDASPFQDGDKLYLYWKNDGNCCGIPTYLYVQELSPDGLSLVGQPTRLIQNDQPWEGRVVEGPEMYKHDTGYYLFFSAGNYADTTYSVGYASCDTPIGPCKVGSDSPILHSKIEKEPLVIGPGGQALIDVGGQTWMVYHVWDEVSGSRGDSRYMWLDRVDWQDSKPVVHGPTTERQPEPAVP